MDQTELELELEIRQSVKGTQNFIRFPKEGGQTFLDFSQRGHFLLLLKTQLFHFGYFGHLSFFRVVRGGLKFLTVDYIRFHGGKIVCSEKSQ